MKTYFLYTLGILWSSICSAAIIEMEEMEKIFYYLQEAGEKTWVIFDVDMVLVQPSDPAFQMANMKRFSSICKQIMKEIPPEKQPLFLSLMTMSSDPVLIDERTPEFIQMIRNKGAFTMVLTANLTGSFRSIPCMERWRIESLKNLKIDFSQGAPSNKEMTFDHLPSYRGNYSTYLEGMLFVNGTSVSKGEAFLAFLEKTDVSPEHVVFIDDREENLKNLEMALQRIKKPISYTGIHFTGAQYYPSQVIKEEEFTSKWQALKKEIL